MYVSCNEFLSMQNNFSHSEIMSNLCENSEHFRKLVNGTLSSVGNVPIKIMYETKIIFGMQKVQQHK